MSASTPTPVWTWLPGAAEPVQAGELWHDGHLGRFAYAIGYQRLAGARPLDPMQLRLRRAGAPLPITGADGLPGVVRDAMPDGYGRDRLQARHARPLAPLELLALGPADAAGAIEVTHDIEAKLRWRPHALQDLLDQVKTLEEAVPSSRAVRQLLDDAGTSAGGERPKLTVQADGLLWLAKLQDRGDAPHLPAREYVVMQLAGELGLRVPRTVFFRHGPHEVFLIERFDRAGDPARPRRHLYASAHTVLGLGPDTLPGDPRRSYLVLADKMRRWVQEPAGLQADLAELWRRMAFNALVGNRDDHPRNHALIDDGAGWRLSPAFDITPLPSFTGVLAMGVLPDGSQEASARSLLSVCGHFGLDTREAGQWLAHAASHVAGQWALRLRVEGVEAQQLDRFAPAFRLAAALAESPHPLECTVDELATQPSRARRRRTRT